MKFCKLFLGIFLAVGLLCLIAGTVIIVIGSQLENERQRRQQQNFMDRLSAEDTDRKRSTYPDCPSADTWDAMTIDQQQAYKTKVMDIRVYRKMHGYE